ncbi:MAG: CRISPR-associated endonuclease Cas2 [Chloroflexi bacterium 44-23]|nr:MAG: CRISPR-associated endonuclease Cas2 [Chloroflexi bacterium 44-23]
MLLLVTYDVNTETKAGKKRLRKVAKVCQNYGQRVQNSVFECLVEPAQYRLLQSQIVDMMDKEKDSVRFYNLGNEWKKRVEHVGAKPSLDLEGVIIA